MTFIQIRVVFLAFFILINGLCTHSKAGIKKVTPSIEGTWVRKHPKSTTDRSIYEYVTYQSDPDEILHTQGQVQTIYQLREGKTGPIIATNREQQSPIAWTHFLDQHFKIYHFHDSKESESLCTGTKINPGELTKTNKIIKLTATTLEYYTINFADLVSQFHQDPNYENLSDHEKLTRMNTVIDQGSKPWPSSKYKRSKQKESIDKMADYPWIVLAKNALTQQLGITK